MAAAPHRRTTSWWSAFRGRAVIVVCAVVAGLGVGDAVRYRAQQRAVIAAAWVGARSGATAPTESDRLDVARQAARSVLGEDGPSDPTRVAASLTRVDGTEYVTVDVRMPFRGLLGLPPGPAVTRARSTWPIGDGVAMLE